MTTTPDAPTLAQRVSTFLDEHDPASTDRAEFLRARFDAGLAWVHYPEGLGGLGAEPGRQAAVDRAFAEAGAPDNRPRLNVIGLGMAAPVILRFGTPEQRERWLGSLWTSEDIWCQLFSEPGAGSDLAGVATSAVRDGDGWVLNGQKVWTSMAHHARWGIILARHDPESPKHRGLTFFVVDMQAPGVEVRGLRQITGEAEFNEVFLTDVRVPDDQRLGEVGQGWAVAQYTLMNERVAIGGGTLPRESGAIGALADSWREQPDARTPGLHDRLLSLWVRTEAARLTAERLGQQQAVGQPGPEGSGVKITFAQLNQACSALELEFLDTAGLRYPDYTERRPEVEEYGDRDAGWRYLRYRANSIEGGTSEVLRNVVAERVLGLPAEPRADKDVPWKDLPPMSRPSTPETGDLLYSEIEDDLRASVRALLDKQAPWDAVLARTDTGDPVDADLWARLAAEVGVAGLAVPEERGGAGASWREAAVVAEELGRTVAPVPFLGSAVVATALLLETGEDELLAALAAGERTAALAVPATATAGRSLTPTVEVRDGTLHGSVAAVADAVDADVLLVPTADGLYAVDAADVGRTVVVSLDMTRRLVDLRFDGAAGRQVLADAGPAVEHALRVGAAILASEQLGLAERCLADTVEYLRTRHQFGRELASYQALKHRLADLWVAITQARAVARYAANCAAEGSPDLPVAAAVAQAHAAEVALLAAEESLQLHGGIGFTWEHPAHLFLKRAKADALLLGSPDRHRAVLAGLVDLPA